jgi:cation:H+ antiporter
VCSHTLDFSDGESVNIIFLIFGALGLYFGAEWLIRGAASLALRWGVSQTIVGLTIIGYGTSSPELMVSIDAGLNNQPEISLGNIVGSNICNIGLIVGISLLIRPLVFDRALAFTDGPFMLGAALLLPLTFYFGDLGRLTGSIYLALLIFYTCLTIYRSRSAAKAEEEMIELAIDPQMPLWKEAGLCIGGLSILLISARAFLWGAVAFAKYFGISDAVVGLTIVAVGTSLPELATSAVAAFKNQGDIALGNIVGSNIYNILGILGAVGIVSPLSGVGIGALDYAVLLSLTICFYAMLYFGRRLGRLSGACLLGAYIAYAAFLYSA